MRLIPVLDVLQGCVVHGRAGRRETYRPLVSPLVSGSAPVNVAQAMRREFGLSELYLADLDGIVHGRPHWELYQQLQDCGLTLLVDFGASGWRDVQRVLELGATAILGLETWPSLECLREALGHVDRQRVIFSLDLQAGQPLGGRRWPSNPLAIAAGVLEAGIERVLVLDLSGVGSQGGVSTLPLCQAIRRLRSDIELTTGGGVRSTGDLQSLVEGGIDAVLVATALHNGRLSPEAVRQWGRRGSAR